MSDDLLEQLNISLAVDNNGRFTEFAVTSEAKDGFMISKDQLYVFGTLLTLISNNFSNEYIKGWLLGFLSQNRSVS